MNTIIHTHMLHTYKPTYLQTVNIHICASCILLGHGHSFLCTPLRPNPHVHILQFSNTQTYIPKHYRTRPAQMLAATCQSTKTQKQTINASNQTRKQHLPNTGTIIIVDCPGSCELLWWKSIEKKDNLNKLE